MSKIEFTNNNLLLAGRKFSAEVQSLFKNVVALFGLKESLLFAENVFSAPCAVSLRDFLVELTAKNSRISCGGIVSANGLMGARPEFFTSLTDLQLWETRGKTTTASPIYARPTISQKVIVNSRIAASKTSKNQSVRAQKFPSASLVRAYRAGYKVRNGTLPSVRDIQKRFKEYKGDKESWEKFLKTV